MVFTLDSVTLLNLILTLIITILGSWIYTKKKDTSTLSIGIAFGLFAISHAMALFGLGDLTIVLIPLRALAYLIIIFALYMRLRK
jgi:hypothetical protein